MKQFIHFQFEPRQVAHPHTDTILEASDSSLIANHALGEFCGGWETMPRAEEIRSKVSCTTSKTCVWNKLVSSLMGVTGSRLVRVI